MNDTNYKPIPPEFKPGLIRAILTGEVPPSLSARDARQLRKSHKRLYQFVTDGRLAPVLKRLRSSKRLNYKSTTEPLHTGTAFQYRNQSERIAAWLILLPRIVDDQPFQIGSQVRNPDPQIITVKTGRSEAKIRARIIAITEINRGLFGGPLYGITADALNILTGTHLTRERVRRIAGLYTVPTVHHEP